MQKNSLECACVCVYVCVQVSCTHATLVYSCLKMCLPHTRFARVCTGVCSMLLLRKLRLSVLPPFMYGNRSPLVSGLIRFDDEVSTEAKRMYFGRSDEEHIVEVVSDDSVARSTDPDHIEAGAGLWRSSGIAYGFLPVGTSNNDRTYHAAQARLVAQQCCEDALDESGGLAVTIDHTPHVLSPGYKRLNVLLSVDIPRVHAPGYEIETTPLSELSQFQFALAKQPRDIVHFVCKFNNTLYGGVSQTDKKFSDPFITTDCPEDEAIRVLSALCKGKHLYYSSNDKYMHSILSKYTTSQKLEISAIPINMDQQKQNFVLKTPWLASSLLQFLPERYTHVSV